MSEEERRRESEGSGRQREGSGRPRVSPFSPFPFGSPLQQGLQQSSFSGSPGQKLLLNAGRTDPHSRTRTPTEVVTPRLKGQELYGGPVMFGGASSSFRRNRMLSASPYSAALRSRQTERAARLPSSVPPAPSSVASSSTSSSPSPNPPAPDSMSSTARLILDTLDKMSTPIQDARRMPTLVQPRAEKRKLLEDSLSCSLSSPQRRRVRLGSGALSLGGPPLRKTYSPVSSPRSNGMAPPTALLTNGATPYGLPASPFLPPSTAKAPPAPPSPPLVLSPPPPKSEPAPPPGKSTFKLKTKVADSGRSSAPSASPLATSLPLVPLPVHTMPVFDLAAPTPVPNGVKEKVEGVEEIRRGKEEVERNNNTRKRAAQPDTEVSGKKRAAEVTPGGGPKEAPSGGLGAPSGGLGAPSGGQGAPAGGQGAPVFAFSKPIIVITQGGSLPPASRRFSFPAPAPVCPPPNTSVQGLKTVSTQGDRRLLQSFKPASPSTAAQPKMMFNSMPDVTNNLVRKVPAGDSNKGGQDRLPDLGLGPATQLRTGSVMDILGKKS